MSGKKRFLTPQTPLGTTGHWLGDTRIFETCSSLKPRAPGKPRRFIPWRIVIAACFFLLSVAIEASPGSEVHSNEASAKYVGNEACAKCHGAIYQAYMRSSAMAHASGPADENLIAGQFTHKPSNVRYAIYRDGGKVWLSYERPGDLLVHGKRELLYYIGEGRRGRTYLFSEDGFVFESPVNWYADRKLWDMAPAYIDATEIPLNLPALTSCLNCHVSGVRAPVAGTENKYATPIFRYSGVTCERCHGPGGEHVRGGAIVNPRKLPTKLRDQVCMQCHLEGNAAIERAGKHIYEYTPGADLTEYVRYFVLAGNVPAGLRATSQFEALAQSVCKKKSGDAMSCTSCHDPHETVPAEQRAAFYTAKCIVCHGESFAAKHHRKEPNCATCHMPASLSSDVAHTEVTDHRILRDPLRGAAASSNVTAMPDLIPFPPLSLAEQDGRELALAWQSLVDSGMTMAQPKADQLLRAALREFPHDPGLLSALGYSSLKRGDSAYARTFYQAALQSDPAAIDAATNLGVLDATQGHPERAIPLWQNAFERAPGRSQIGMNLARLFCQSGQFKDARNSVLRVLRFNPDLGSAKMMLNALNADPPRCAP
jgi:Tetratricopeptide repeat/Cytochrome c554 and c-prime